MSFYNKKTSSGLALVELMVACSIIVITTFTLVSASQKGVALSERALRQTQADSILEEGAEATKTIRDAAWANVSSPTITAGTTYYLSYNTSTNVWSLSTTPNTIDSIFTRKVVFATVTRDANDDIAASGTTDTRTIKVTITVSWPSSSGTLSKSLSFYMADIFS